MKLQNEQDIHKIQKQHENDLETMTLQHQQEMEKLEQIQTHEMEKQREEAYQIIIQNAIAWGVGRCTPEEIDQINILNASRLAMERAIDNMNHDFDFLLTDAVKMYKYDKPREALIHGDALSQCIAAASIIAKVSRDHYCYELDKKYPNYHIAKHKGYGTKDHLEALEKYGPVKGLHRFSYGPIKKFFVEKISLF